MRPNKSISLPDTLWERIDAARGDVSRSVFIERKLERALGSRPDEVSVAPASSRASDEYVLPKIARRS